MPAVEKKNIMPHVLNKLADLYDIALCGLIKESNIIMSLNYYFLAREMQLTNFASSGHVQYIVMFTLHHPDWSTNRSYLTNCCLYFHITSLCNMISAKGPLSYCCHPP